MDFDRVRCPHFQNLLVTLHTSHKLFYDDNPLAQGIRSLFALYRFLGSLDNMCCVQAVLFH